MGQTGHICSYEFRQQRGVSPLTSSCVTARGLVAPTHCPGPCSFVLLGLSRSQNTALPRRSLGPAARPSLAGTLMPRRTPVITSSTEGVGAIKTTTSPRRSA